MHGEMAMLYISVNVASFIIDTTELDTSEYYGGRCHRSDIAL